MVPYGFEGWQALSTAGALDKFILVGILYQSRLTHLSKTSFKTRLRLFENLEYKCVRDASEGFETS